MDVVYMDSYGREVGILPWVEGDFTIGKSNTFELKIPKNLNISQDWMLAIDGTEYGGVIDGVEVDTSEDYLLVSGRTWHGVLQESVLRPDSGADYLTVSGDLNTILGNLITRQDKGFCLAANTEASGFTVNNYQFDRYIDAYTGIRDLLKSVGCKLNIKYSPSLRKAVLSAVKRGEYIDNGLDGDKVEFIVSKNRPVNHLVGLGKGELKDRTVIDVYADENGNVSTKQTLFGVKHKEETYEAPSTEDSKLEEDCIKKLEEMQGDLSTCEMKDSDSGSDYDIDDVVGGVYAEQGISVTTYIAQKIATIKGEVLTIDTNTENEVV